METLNDPQLKSMVQRCAVWALGMKQHNPTPSWLSLLGNAGTGKTHCATKLWNWAEKRFSWNMMGFIHTPIYWPEFVDGMRNGEGFERFREMFQWPVLFVDDIGAERDTTGFASEKLNTLLGSRVRKWTILTSNLNLEQLANIDTRIADRIIREPGNQFIELTTQSYALRKS